MNSSPTQALFAACEDGNFHGLVTILWPLQEYMSLPHPIFCPSFEMKGRGRNPYTDRRGDLGGRGLPLQSRLRGQPLPQSSPQPRLQYPQQEQGTG